MWSEAQLHWSTVIASVTKNRDSWYERIQLGGDKNSLINNQPSIISDFALVASCDIKFANKLSESYQRMSKNVSWSIDNAATQLIDVRIDRIARERLTDLPERDYSIAIWSFGRGVGKLGVWGLVFTKEVSSSGTRKGLSFIFGPKKKGRSDSEMRRRREVKSMRS